MATKTSSEPRRFVVAHTGLDSYRVGKVLSEDVELKGIDIKRLLRLGAIQLLAEGSLIVDGVIADGLDGGEQDQEPEA